MLTFQKEEGLVDSQISYTLKEEKKDPHLRLRIRSKSIFPLSPHDLGFIHLPRVLYLRPLYRLLQHLYLHLVLHQLILRHLLLLHLIFHQLLLHQQILLHFLLHHLLSLLHRDVGSCPLLQPFF